MTEAKKEFSLEDLKACNGAEGKPAYIVYQRRVIDVSASKHWHGGRHMGAHLAGHDLTGEISDAPHGPEVLGRFPEVGVLRQPEAEPENIPDFLSRLFHYLPLLKRHPHPMMVHFPIVFMMSVAGFNLLYLWTGDPSFEITAWHCLWGGVLFTLPAIATGLFTWWINFDAEFLPQVVIKMILSPIMLATGIVALVWRQADPDILVVWRPLSYVYLGCILILAPLAGAIGWFGGTLSFPLKGE